jgi:flavin reductase (DIM6/NTAB) family NADH-FMN oxidoreductase RutF
MAKKKIGPQTLLFPTPVLLVGVMVSGKPNFMTVAWGGLACSKPPMLSVAIRGARYTLRGIKENMVFSVNIPKTGSVKNTDYCGVHSGTKVDKSKIFKVFYGNDQKIPLIEECPVCFECKVVHQIELGSHVLVIGEIMETHIDEDCFDNEMPSIKKIDPLVYATGSHNYYGIGAYVAEAFKG